MQHSLRMHASGVLAGCTKYCVCPMLPKPKCSIKACSAVQHAEEQAPPSQTAAACRAVGSRLHALADVILLAESKQLADVVGPLGPAHPRLLVICQPRQGARPCKISQPVSSQGH